MTPVRRRAFVALTATAATALAGCGGRLPGTGPKTIDGTRLHRMAARDAPSIPQTLPVPIEASYVDAQTDEARSVLADVPAPFHEAQIPNGVIRDRLNYRYEAAQRNVAAVPDGPTPFVRLSEAGHARTSAHEVRATWRAIDVGLTMADVGEGAPAIRDAIDAFVSRWSYVGDDPVRALPVHAELEQGVHGARARVDDADGTEEDPFEVGEAASDLERARVDVDTSTYLFERFRGTLERETDLKPRLTDARETLRDRYLADVESLPDVDARESPAKLVDRSVGETAGLWALVSLYEAVQREAHGVRSVNAVGPRLALDLLEVTEARLHLRAFERLRARIEDGDDVSISSAADVVALREAAVSAVEDARTADRARVLVRSLLPYLSRPIEWADEEFQRSGDEVTVPEAERDAADYVVTAANCGVLPDVAGEIATVLRET